MTTPLSRVSLMTLEDYARARKSIQAEIIAHRRLRSVLRQHMGLRGIAKVRGEDQVRWPNVFFADHGLFSLQKNYEAVRQSSRG